MARKLRKMRVAAALILVIFVGGICFFTFKACSKNAGNKAATPASVSGNVQTDASKNGGNKNGGEETDSAGQAVAWPTGLSNYVKEYTGAGKIVLAESSKNDEGKTVYRVRYKGTTIDSCFGYSKDTLGISSDWTEVITDEHYTLSRETDKYVLDLSCEPKAEKGYDFQISLKIK